MSSTSDIPHPTSDILHRFLDLLLDTNARFNLTAVRDRDSAWRRLILDSLTLLPGLEELPPGSRVIDIGTGGGIPGIPLAISLPGAGVKFTLLDATGKKIAFIKEAIETLGLTNAAALQGRAEQLGHDPRHRQQYDVAISRAVGTVSEVLEYALPLVKVGGRVLMLKGAETEKQLATAGDALQQLGGGEVAVFDAYEQPEPGEVLFIISIIKDRPTPPNFPRRPGVPKAQPL